MVSCCPSYSPKQADLPDLLCTTKHRFLDKKTRPGERDGPAGLRSPAARVVASQNSPLHQTRARRITARDSRESSKLNLQANTSPRPKIRQIRLLVRAPSFSPFNGF